MWHPTSEDLQKAADSVCYVEYTETDIDFDEVPELPMRVNPSNRDGPNITMRQYVIDRFNYAWRKDGKAMISIRKDDVPLLPAGLTEYCCTKGHNRKIGFYVAGL